MQLGKFVGDLSRMSSLEYTYWCQLAALEPIGPERGDWQAAQVVSMLANVNRDAKAHPRPWSARDFLLWQEPAEMSDDEVEEALLLAFPPENAKE